MMRHLFRGRSVLEIAIATGLFGVLIGVALFGRTIRYGFSALDKPTAMEAFVAGKVRHWSVPSDLRNLNNPLPLTPEVLAEARAHFADHCAGCHGNDGRGNTEMGQRLYPKAPDMTREATQRLSDGEIFSIIENGIRLTGMPGWGEGTAESAYGSWTLVHLIRHMPKLTSAEIEEMEKMNPVSPAEMREAQSEEDFLAGEDTTSSSAGENTQQNHH